MWSKCTKPSYVGTYRGSRPACGGLTSPVGAQAVSSLAAVMVGGKER